MHGRTHIRMGPCMEEPTSGWVHAWKNPHQDGSMHGRTLIRMGPCNGRTHIRMGSCMEEPTSGWVHAWVLLKEYFAVLHIHRYLLMPALSLLSASLWPARRVTIHLITIQFDMMDIHVFNLSLCIDV